MMGMKPSYVLRKSLRYSIFHLPLDLASTFIPWMLRTNISERTFVGSWMGTEQRSDSGAVAMTFPELS